MKKHWAILLVVIGACGTGALADDTTKMLADAAAKSNMIAVVSYTYADESGSRNLGGQAICIEPSGIFITLSMATWMKPDNFKNMQVTGCGIDAKPMDAKLLWVDRQTGIGFFKTVQKGSFEAAKFNRNFNYAVGTRVASVGVMEGDAAHSAYVSCAYIGAVVRTPDRVVMVTGGRLTCDCSPVFDESGGVIGLVGQQAFLRYETPTQQGVSDVYLRGRQETSFFRPLSEFAFVLDYFAKSPDKPRQLPWIGAISFMGINTSDEAFSYVKHPAVQVDQVIANQNGAKAGLRNQDIIIGMNGKSLEKLGTPKLISDNFQRTVLQMLPGQTLSLAILRDKKETKVDIVLEPMPPQPADAPRFISQALGMIVRDKVMLDEHVIKTLVAGMTGVLVAEVQQRGPAQTAGMIRDDLIVGVNDQAVKSVDALKKIVEKSLKEKADRDIVFQVRRGEKTQSITVRPQVPTAEGNKSSPGQ